jgi:hypothetical protein
MGGVAHGHASSLQGHSVAPKKTIFTFLAQVHITIATPVPCMSCTCSTAIVPYKFSGLEPATVTSKPTLKKFRVYNSSKHFGNTRAVHTYTPQQPM